MNAENHIPSENPDESLPQANNPATPVSVDPVEMIDAELNEEFQRARASVDATADAAQAAIDRHNAARTIFEYVGSKIRERYALGVEDRIAPDGEIMRAEKRDIAAPLQAG